MKATNHAHQVAAELRAELGAAPTPDELVSYHQGTLGDEDRRRVRAYLALSPEAAQTVLDLDQLPAADEDDAYDVEASWRRLQASLPVLARADEPPLPASARPQPWLLAALVVLALGSSFGLGRWSQPPSTYTRLVEATLSLEGTRGGSALQVPAGAEAVSLSLIVAEGAETTDWRVELRRLDSPPGVILAKPIWPLAEGYAQLIVPAADLADGSYEIHLFAGADSSSELGRYVFRVERVN